MPASKSARKPAAPSIFTEQEDIDPDTLANLGPLRGMAGVWEGLRGMDLPPDADPRKKQAFFERIELQPIDPQSNGPQLFYGLRYHTHITKPREVETYHDQVGYWLWEPATGADHPHVDDPARTGGHGGRQGQSRRHPFQAGRAHG